MGLWILTGLIGLPSVDRAFDREFAVGSSVDRHGTKSAPVTRVPFRSLPRPFETVPEVAFNPPGRPWRMRSNGVAVAPFVIIDEAAWQVHPLSVFGGRRVVFWLFGFSTWHALKAYWVS